MKKKILSTVLTLAVSAFMLAGCGAETVDTPTQVTEKEPETKTEVVEEDAKVYNIGICQIIQHEALDAATQGFKDALTEKLGDKVVFDEQNAAGDSATCATIANQFVSNGVDLILANATAPLQAAAAATNEIPVLGTSVTDYATALQIDDWTGATGANISGTSDLAPLADQAKMLQEIFPDAQNVGLLFCSAEPNSVYQVNVVKAELEAMGYTCTEYSFADSNEIASVCTNAVANVDVIYIPTDNAAAAATGTIDSVCSDAKVPVVSGEEGICKGCGVVTLSISYYDLGYQTGLMAYEVLVNGADVSTMQVQFAPNVTKKYVASRCEALNIVIPEGYEAIEEE